ncbi:quercetin 2,3-dioxygenase [Tamilnaduibacter salinus]|uniref:Quercetin 2,3-dioxygenase n=1 Tax=Tamilnaduibacter salinus TaxID=1484056 RepID=A0A2A2I1F3_9GAMM|nr:pirin family protein [Tamilnaduibacter salinus]PAV25114.1 quercetin 2,3-dioxygenase [Tamilnaduibacter salinus]
MKNIQATYTPSRGHWVGNGFPVRSLLSYDRMGARNISPFLMLDYAGPAQFGPAKQPRGVGRHPHRGFETVTLVYQGELAHRDSTGAGGLIGEGDVQWMTAGAGIVHEEFHSPAFTEQGGTLEMVQLWVNLPAEHKNVPAAYQTLLDQDIPRVPLGEHDGTLRVIAGDYEGHRGPAGTFTPVNVWDVALAPGGTASLSLPETHNVLLVMLKGTVLVNGQDVVREADTVRFGREGGAVSVDSNNDARLLVLSGEPIDEPVVGHGPFVMTTSDEIHQAITDFERGRFDALNR